MATFGNNKFNTYKEDYDKNDNTFTEPDIENIDTEETSTEEIDTTNLCTITDTNTPIMILFGPSQCGKSMTMVRLVRYLENKGMSCEPCTDFRPSIDKMYKQRCAAYRQTIDTFEPLPGTDYTDYMLVAVQNTRGDMRLQILEAPGEHYFSLTNPYPEKAPYPAYLSKIKNCNAPKIWCFFLEPDWQNHEKASQYVHRIRMAKSFINLNKDKIIFLYNKIDKKPQWNTFGKLNMQAAAEYAAKQYRGLFTLFKDTTLLGKITNKYLFKFVPFSTGDFDDVAKTFTESSDIYPEMLCKAINLKID